jgi:hypothetical protein
MAVLACSPVGADGGVGLQAQTGRADFDGLVFSLCYICSEFVAPLCAYVTLSLQWWFTCIVEGEQRPSRPGEGGLASAR